MTQPDSPIYTCAPDIPISEMGLMDLLWYTCGMKNQLLTEEKLNTNCDGTYRTLLRNPCSSTFRG